MSLLTPHLILLLGFQKDLLAELADLDGEEVSAQLLSAPTVPSGTSAPAAAAPAAVPSLPSAPIHMPVGAMTDEEAELAALEASMM